MKQFDTSVDNMLFFNTKKQRKTIPVDTAPVVLHFRPDYESSETHQRVHNEIVQQTGCVRFRVKTWKEFVDAIRDEQPDIITIHQSVIDNHHQTLEEFGATIQSLVQYLPKHKHNGIVPVAIGIESDTTQQFVTALHRAGFAGIWPSATAFGSKKCVDAMQVFLSNQEYWPADIINQLPGGNELPVSVYFRADHGTYITDAMTEQLKKDAKFQLQYCTNWDELSAALKNRPSQLVFYIGMLTRLDLSIAEIVESLNTKLKLFEIDIPIAVGIDPDTSVTVIKELKRAGVFGLVPSAGHWGTEATVTALNALACREPYWPKNIIDQLPGNKHLVERASTNGIKLTVRQQEVMDLICHRGLSNKQIAKTLNLSESTVKIHVSAVMKSYGVRNRTQLALSAGAGLKA